MGTSNKQSIAHVSAIFVLLVFKKLAIFERRCTKFRLFWPFSKKLQLKVKKLRRICKRYVSGKSLMCVVIIRELQILNSSVKFQV